MQTVNDPPSQLGILFLLTSAILDWLLHSEGGKSEWLEFWTHIFSPPCKPTVSHPATAVDPISQQMCAAFLVSLPQCLVSKALMLTTHPYTESSRLPHSLDKKLIYHLICIIVPPAPNIPQSFLMLKRL